MTVIEIIEIFALVTGVAYVVLEILQKNAMWVVGILTGAACAYSFAVQRSWGMMGLNLYYIVMSVIGLVQWRKDGAAVGEDVIHLRPLPKKTAVWSAVGFVLGSLVLIWVFRALGDGVSELDAPATVLSVIATWWLTRSYIQQWMRLDGVPVSRLHRLGGVRLLPLEKERSGTMILIVESGATKTDWCLVDAGKPVRRLQTPGMNLSTIAAEANASVFADAVETFADVDEVHFYAAGLLEFPAELDRIFKERFPGVRCEYASDLLAAARAACGHEAGLAAILGTGSNTCHYDGEKIVRNIHGGGFIIGDEGSAAALGRLFLADLVKELVPEELVEAFSAFHEADYASVVRNVYKNPAPSRYLGSLAPFILEHRGEAYVDALVDRNFRDLFERALTRYDRLPVGVVGGFGCACRAELERLGAEYGLTFSRFIPSPMEGLVDYHGV